MPSCHSGVQVKSGKTQFDRCPGKAREYTESASPGMTMNAIQVAGGADGTSQQGTEYYQVLLQCPCSFPWEVEEVAGEVQPLVAAQSCHRPRA